MAKKNRRQKSATPTPEVKVVSDFTFAQSCVQAWANVTAAFEAAVRKFGEGLVEMINETLPDKQVRVQIIALA